MHYSCSHNAVIRRVLWSWQRHRDTGAQGWVQRLAFTYTNSRHVLNRDGW